MSSNHLRKSPDARRIDYWRQDMVHAARWQMLVNEGCSAAMPHVVRCLLRAVEWRALASAADFETDAGTEFAAFIRRFMA